MTPHPAHRIATPPGASLLVSIEVDARTVQRGDQLMIGGQEFTVSDMTALGSGRKRLTFATGEMFTMNPTTVLWAARRIDPRLRRWMRR
ncbi:hypothetical protein [Streptomyces litchfieldiae]|uniref:Uncharacterized protein n=1 Tax=Streptomyces litchfieldiae TaxID=3075543 RepID=A0ABU2N0G9_9ACTN|nr:hypothetical protein [Streptomyces sp. DSM 44938]MDT0347023.1 hypothetical protein [Streptomyces sp. DSM 44938]